MNRYITILSCVFLLMCSVTGFAALDSGSGWFVAVEGGRAASSNHTNTTTQTMPGTDLQDDYVSNHLDATNVVGAGFGYAFCLPTAQWFPIYRVGLMYDQYANANVDGILNKWQTVPAYSYQYQVKSKVIWLDNQIDVITWNNLSPFVDVAIGVSQNKAQNYSETPLPGNTDPRLSPADFGSNTQTAFAYRVGFGLDYAVIDHFHVSVAYRYENRGNAKTGGSANYATMSNGLTDQLRTSEVIAGLRYDF